MANLGTAYFNVAPDMRGVQGKIAGGLKGSGSRFANQFGGEVSGKSALIIGALAGIASAAATKAMNIITNSVGDAIKRVDTLNNSAKTFQYMGFSAASASKATKALEKSIKGLPTPLDSAMRGMTSLAATYGDVGLGQKVFSSLNNAILGFGGSADMVENAITQISQLPLDGPLDAQTWNSLRNSGLTPVLVAMSKEFGMSVSQMKTAFGEGELTVKDFTDKLTEMNVKGGGGLVSLEKIARSATSGIGTGIANMQTAVVRGVANIIQAVGSKRISQAIGSIGAGFEKVLNLIAQQVPKVVDALDKMVSIVANNKDVFASAAAGIMAIVAALIALKAYNAIANTISELKAVSTAAKLGSGAVQQLALQTKLGTVAQAAYNAVMSANPIAIIILAITGLIAALAFFFTQTETGKKIFGQFVGFLGGVWDNIKAGVQSVGGFFSKAWDVVKQAFSSVVEFIKTNWRAVVVALTGPLGLAIVWIIDNWGRIKKTFIDTKNSIVQTMGGIWNAIKPFIQPLIDGFGDAGKAIGEAFNSVKGVISSIGASFSGAKDQFNNSFGGMSEVIKPIMDSLKNTWDSLKKSWDSVVQTISPTIETLKSSFTTAWNDIKKAMQPVIEIFKQARDALGEFWDAHGEKVITGLKILGGIFLATIVAPIAIAVGAIVVLGVVLAKIIEWVAKVITWVNKFASAFIDIAQPYIEGFAKALGAIISGIVNHIVNLVTTVIGIFTGIVQVVAGVITGIVSIVGGIISGVVTIITSVFSGIVQFFSGWFQIIHGLFTGNWEMVKKGAMTILSGFITIVVGLFNGLVQILAGIWNGLVAIGEGIWNGLSTIVMSIITGFINNIVNSFNTVMTVIGAIMGGIWGTIVNIWNLIKGAVMSAISGLISIVTVGFNAIVAAIRWYITTAFTVLKTIWNLITSAVRGALTALLNIVSTIWNTIKNTIVNVARGIWGAISGAFNNIVNGIRNTFNNAINFLRGIIGRFIDVGRDIINGIVRGIQGGRDMVIGKVKEIASGAVDAVKSFLGIKSPSRVFAAIGRDLDRGLAQGILQNAGMVTKAVNNLSTDAVNGMAGVNTSISAAMNPMSPGQGAQGGNNTTQTVTIQKVVLADASAVKEFFNQLNQDTIRVGMGITTKQGAQ